MVRNFRDGLIQVAGLKWKHYSMSWHLSVEVGGWLGAQTWQPADARLVLTSDTGLALQLYSTLEYEILISAIGTGVRRLSSASTGVGSPGF